jgi:hypothetical protein
MLKTPLAALALACALAVPAGASTGVGSTGPFVGRLGQGQTQSYVYDNNPSGQPCLALAATYTITLHYLPGTDVLSLSAVTKTATGAGGLATLSVTQGICARFTIGVTGTSVADTATYAVTVTRQVLGPIS